MGKGFNISKKFILTSLSPQKLTLAFLFLILTSGFIRSAQAEQPQGSGESPHEILYLGEDPSDWHDAPVLAALRLEKSFQTHQLKGTEFTQESLEGIDFVVIQDQNLTFTQIDTLSNWVRQGNSVSIFCGERTASSPEVFQEFGIVNSTQKQEIMAGYTNAVPGIESSNEERVENNGISSGIQWKTFPDCSNYTIFPKTQNITEHTLISKISRADSARTVNDSLIFYNEHGAGRVSVFSFWLEDRNSYAFAGAPYFNYLVYSTVVTNNGETTEKAAFHEWDESIVPHTTEKTLFLLLIGVAVLIGGAIILRAKRNSKRDINRDVLESIAEEEKKSDMEEKLEQEEILKETFEISEDEISKKGQIPSKDGEQQTPENNERKGEGTPAEEMKQNKSKEDQDEEPSGEMSAAERTKMWDKIGLHKQISGFFSSLVTALIAAGPQIVLVLLIYPRYIMPFPSAQGNFTIINDLFAAIWLFLDVGTSQALVTYFSKHRVERPEKAVHYIQIYIFWQLTTGILQFGVITILGLYYFPTNAQFAHLSYNFIIHSMVQFPGFLMVNILVLRALQRTDLEQIASLLSSFVFKIVIQYACVLLFRQLFENNVRFGEIFGALIGLNVGTWIGGFADYLFAGYLFKKAGYERKMFFRWDFTKEELKEVLVYGIRLVAGNVWVPAVAGLQAILLATHVEDYSSEMAYYQLALTIGQVVALVSMLTNSLQSPISESFTFKEEHGKEKYLARVYTSSFKWVNFINLFLISTLFVLGWRIIITFSGPTWTRATFYLNMVLVFQLLGAYSWIGDKFMLGCNKTKTIMWIWIVEQGVRALGLLIFIPRFGMAGVLFAYIPGLLSKDILLIVAIRKKIIAPKWHLWRIWGIPIVSALINYGLFELFARALWQNDILTTLVLFFLGIFGFINLFAVLTAWLGGWDETELMELKLARDIAPKKLSIILRMLYASVDFGLGLKSPFKGKFPIELWEESQKEMNELQDLKKELQL